jgi:hypothetical protein
MYDKAFLTGCDKNTEWMVDWWFENYTRHNEADIPLIFANFGITPEARERFEDYFDHIIDLESHKTKNWFLKPEAMLKASEVSKKICWIDTDCEILKPIDKIFDSSVERKLGMVQDLPWTKRRGEIWHNSGVVLFEGKPKILKDWKRQIDHSPTVGDQEVLHLMLRDDPLKRRIYIEDLPNAYNWLRIQLLDGQDSPKKKIVHWTGFKGKLHIRKMIENA